jgi:DNA-binding NtrC family response regulator
VNARRRLLLIDHDASFLRTLSEVLQLEGFQTAIANDLDHARRLMANDSPAAVLLHLHMGTVSPRDAVLALHAANPTTTLVVYSGQTGAAEEVENVVPPDWIHAYLQKPFAIEEVTKVLNGIRERG